MYRDRRNQYRIEGPKGRASSSRGGYSSLWIRGLYGQLTCRLHKHLYLGQFSHSLEKHTPFTESHWGGSIITWKSEAEPHRFDNGNFRYRHSANPNPKCSLQNLRRANPCNWHDKMGRALKHHEQKWVHDPWHCSVDSGIKICRPQPSFEDITVNKTIPDCSRSIISSFTSPMVDIASTKFAKDITCRTRWTTENTILFVVPYGS